jgi:hypothetical protein
MLHQVETIPLQVETIHPQVETILLPLEITHRQLEIIHHLLEIIHPPETIRNNLETIHRRLEITGHLREITPQREMVRRRRETLVLHPLREITHRDQILLLRRHETIRRRRAIMARLLQATLNPEITIDHRLHREVDQTAVVSEVLIVRAVQMVSILF